MTLCWVRVSDGPLEELAAEMVIGPAKPAELATVTFDEPDPPAEKVIEGVSVLMEKSVATVTLTIVV